MNRSVLGSIGNGIYAIGVSDGKIPSACIVSSLMQITNNPDMIAISMNRTNYSYECIKKNKLFTVSVLSRNTSGAVIGALGYSTGKHGGKLCNVRYKMLREGVPVIKEETSCWFLCKVLKTIETDDHVVLVAAVLAGSEKIKGIPMSTYYYKTVIKGSFPKASPSYQPHKNDPNDPDGQTFTCKICKYVYDDPVIPFEELPENWICPVCGAPKSVFLRNK